MKATSFFTIPTFTSSWHTPPPITMADLLQAVDFWHGEIWSTYYRWSIFEMKFFWHLVWANLMLCNFSLFPFKKIPLYISKFFWHLVWANLMSCNFSLFPLKKCLCTYPNLQCVYISKVLGFKPKQRNHFAVYYTSWVTRHQLCGLPSCPTSTIALWIKTTAEVRWQVTRWAASNANPKVIGDSDEAAAKDAGKTQIARSRGRTIAHRGRERESVCVCVWERESGRERGVWSTMAVVQAVASIAWFGSQQQQQKSGGMEEISSSAVWGWRLQVPSLLPQQPQPRMWRYPLSSVVCKQSTTSPSVPSSYVVGSFVLSLFFRLPTWAHVVLFLLRLFSLRTLNLCREGGGGGMMM